MLQNDTGFMSLVAAEAISAGQRVHVNTSQQFAVSGVSRVCTGVAITDAASGEVVTAKLLTAPGTHVLIAAVAITAGAQCFGAAAGKASTVPTNTERWRCLEPATADNAKIGCILEGIQPEVLPRPTPFAETAAATISAADILNGLGTLTQATGATVALTLDTGANMDLAFTDVPIGGSVEWSLINLSAAAADTGTLTASSGHTIVGVPIIASAHSTTGGGGLGNASRWSSRRTAADTWVTYRVA